MLAKSLLKLFASSLLILTFSVTSIGGSFLTAAYAASPSSDTEQKDSVVKKEVAIGLATLGLVAILAGHKNKKEDKQTTTGNNTGGSSGSTRGGSTTPGQSSLDTKAAEQKALQLLNADRKANGLPNLALNGTLTALARDYAQDMIDRNFFSHYNPEGQSPFDRMKQYGVSYVYAGENLAVNSTVEGAEKAFMSSSGHRDNILNPNYTQVGLGVRYNSKGSAYVVQEFIGK